MTTRLLLEGPDLAELVAQVREQFGTRARIVRAERVRTGGFAGFFAKESFEMTVDVPDEPTRSVRAFAHRPPPPRSAPPAASIEDLLDAADAADASPTGGPGTDAARADAARTDAVRSQAGRPDAARTAETRSGGVSTTSEEFAAVLDQVRTLVGLPTPDVVVPPPPAPTAVPTPAAARRPAPVADGGALLRAELVRLGVPASLLDPEPVTLAAVLGRLPQPPPAPRGPGQVLAVVGEGDGPRAVARTLAVRWGLPDDRVVELRAGAAAEPVVRDPAGPRVVALRVGPDTVDRSRAAHTLAALGADQVWAVVDARTKSADGAAWLAAVGAARPVDALAVHGLLDTRAPGTVLELDVPVAWVDGVPASRLVWAAALGQELDAALV